MCGYYVVDPDLKLSAARDDDIEFHYRTSLIVSRFPEYYWFWESGELVRIELVLALGSMPVCSKTRTDSKTQIIGQFIICEM